MPISPLLTCLSGVSTWQLAHVLRHQLICVSVLFRSNFPSCKERFRQTFRPRRKVCPIFSFRDVKLLYLHKHKYLLVEFSVNRLTCQLVYEFHQRESLTITRACNRVIARPCCVIKCAITTKSGNCKRINILLPPQWVFRKTCVYLRYK